MNDARTHRAQAAADDILQFVNAYGFDSDTFAKRIAGGHKTLQQSVMRLFVRTIRRWQLSCRMTVMPLPSSWPNRSQNWQMVFPFR